MPDERVDSRMAQAEPLQRQRQTMGQVGVMGARLARARKAIATALGMAVTLVLLVPAESVPERWRPYVGLVLALGTVLGVYATKNQPPPQVAPTLFARERVRDTEERPRE